MLETLLPGLIGGLLGGARGSSSKTTFNNATNTSTQVTAAQSFGLSNNPVFANVIGPGSTIAPNVTSPIETPVHLQPSFSAPLNQSASDGSGATALPRAVPTGFGGTTASMYRPPVGLGMSDDMLLLLLLVGGAFVLMQPGGK